MATFDEALADAQRLMSLPGVVGVGEGATPDGERSIVVMVTARVVAAVDEIPEALRGVPVEIVETGDLWAEESTDDLPDGFIGPL